MSQAIDKISERGAEEGMGGGHAPIFVAGESLKPKQDLPGITKSCKAY